MKELVCNMLKTECDALVITTNGFVKSNGECVMGRGIAKQIKDLYPKIPKLIGNLITIHGNNVHQILDFGSTTLVTFPVKPDYVINNGSNVVSHCKSKIGETTAGFLAKADLTIIEESCKQLVELVNRQGWKTVLLPRVGCGAGELEYKDVKPILEKYFDDRFIICSFNKEDFIVGEPKQSNTLTIHSGGAKGTDYLFKIICDEQGYEYKGYYHGERSQFNAPYGNVEITEQDYKEGAKAVALAAKYNWGYQYNTMKDPRLIRNWSQVKYSDTIIAVGTIVNAGERVFPNQTNDTRLAINPCVTGGTGYAVSMGILMEKPIFVFDQSRNQWFTFDYKNQEWVYTERPKLEDLPMNIAGIGTREIKENAIEEIASIFGYS